MTDFIRSPQAASPGAEAAAGPLFAVIPEVADAPDDNGTPYVIAPGDSFSGALDSVGDRDRVAVELTAGTVYTLTLQGWASEMGTLIDPYLRLYDDSGTLIAENDDGGQNYESELVFTAGETGLYYLEAGAYADGEAGSYSMGVSVALAETADAPAHDGTPYTMAPGDSFSGTLDSAGDRDWIAIDLTEGQLYIFTMLGAPSGTGTLADPLLRLYDADGTLVASNDDNGTTYESLLGFVAESGGTYYLEAGAYADGYSGSYLIQTEERAPSEPGTLDELADYLTTGYWTDGGEGTRSFDTSADNEITVDITGLSAAGQQLARWAFEAWEMVADLDFVEIGSGSADITFSDMPGGAYSESIVVAGEIVSSTVNVATNWLTSYGTTIDSYSFMTYIHEIGHALGLGHQGNYNSTASYGVDETFSNDSWQLSIMSYFAQDDNSTVDASFAYLATTMMADILAIQTLYGEADGTSATAGATVWGTNSTLGGYIGAMFDVLFDAGTAVPLVGEPLALTIHDQGGQDLLDLSGSDLDQAVDLTPGSLSDILGLTGNLGIARGTVIENLTTGAGNDTLRGNGAANRIEAGAGNDLINGVTGNDFLDGGTGNDTLRGGQGNDSLLGREGNDLVYGGNNHDNIALHGGNDAAWGEAGNDSMGGGDGNDQLYGGSGNDVIGGGTGDDYIDAGDDQDAASGGYGADTVLGGAGDDTLAGSFGNDSVHGGTGDDNLGGGAGRDTMVGNLGNDSIGAGDGDDEIYGGAGNDFLAGGDGDDTIFGGSHADTINAGAGDDVMTGGSDSSAFDGAADLFLFNSYTDGETDTIRGFEDGIDMIRLSGVGPGALSITNVTGGAAVEIGNTGHVIFVEGMTAGTLTADDFIFV